jgi:hypothetical protein
MAKSSKPSTSEIVSTYFRHHLEHDSTLFWAWKEVHDIVLEDPEKGWQLIQELLQAAPSIDCLSYVATGPLESLLNSNGKDFIGRIKAQSKEDKRLLYALSGVYTHEPILSEIKALLKEHDLDALDPIN